VCWRWRNRSIWRPLEGTICGEQTVVRRPTRGAIHVSAMLAIAADVLAARRRLAVGPGLGSVCVLWFRLESLIRVTLLHPLLMGCTKTKMFNIVAVSTNTLLTSSRHRRVELRLRRLRTVRLCLRLLIAICPGAPYVRCNSGGSFRRRT